MKISLVAAILLGSWMIGACSSDQASQDEELKQKIGQLLMVGFRGFELEEGMKIVEDIEDRNLGGVILFDYDVPRDIPERNIRDLAQVQQLNTDLQTRADIPLMIAVDQEGGNVARLKPEHGFHEMPSHQNLGDAGDIERTFEESAKTAERLAELGFNINYAPVTDVNRNPDNPIIGALERSFSEDPEMVARHARAFMEAHHEYGVYSTIKHFPGHGSSRDDTHLGIADVTEYWDEVELQPFQELIDSDLRLIMTAHIFNEQLDPDHPATLSENVITGILREEMDYEGIIVSDDMQMNAITDFYGLEEALELGINAGLDLLVFANNSVYEEDIAERAISKIAAMVEDGRVSRSRIEESYKRIMQFKENLHTETEF